MTTYTKKVIKELYQKYSSFDPFKIAEKLNIEIRYENLPVGKKGLYLPEIEGIKIILLDHSIELSNQRFTILAHELFHALEHSEIAAYYSLGSYQKNSMEYEANMFSSQLILNLFVETRGAIPNNFSQLQNAYGVPEQFREFFF